MRVDRATLDVVSSRRTIARRYAVPGGPYVVLTYREERNRDFWYVTRPDSLGRLRRAILPPFHSYGAAVIAAHILASQSR